MSAPQKTRKPYPQRAVRVLTLPAIHARCIEVGDCWEWQGAVGYGSRHPLARHEGKTQLVRRVAYALSGRTLKDPRGWCIVTTCDNRLCVNPEHLKQITLTEHMTRMAQTGRMSDWARSAKIAATKRAKYAKLTEADVAHIRASNATNRELAAQYGIHTSRISGIRTGRYWRDFSSPWGALLP